MKAVFFQFTGKALQKGEKNGFAPSSAKGNFFSVYYRNRKILSLLMNETMKFSAALKKNWPCCTIKRVPIRKKGVH